jgi:serine/threonine protein kinase
MWKDKEYDLRSIGIEGSSLIRDIPSISLNTLSFFSEKDHSLLTSQSKRRATLKLESKVAHGSYGNLYLAKRKEEHETQEHSVLVKQPRMAEMNLTQEGILQHISHLLLQKEGLGHAVPRVFDIFQKDHKVWFSMELIRGITVQEFFHKSRSPDLDFYLLIAQMSLLLGSLEYFLGLDHRDLKVDNLVIKQEPCTLTFQRENHIWTLSAPFRIVLLDFGFACLGSEEEPERPILNLGDGVLPPMDPCPKQGRDLFQFLISLLGLREFQEKISKSLQDTIDSWLSVGKKSYGNMARRWSTENWSYLVTSQRNFSIPSCCPETILQTILPSLSGFLQFKKLS